MSERIRTLRVAINGTGFAGDYTAKTNLMIPHRNGVTIELAGVVSGQLENAQRFADTHRVGTAFDSHYAMIEAIRPDIDNICCANFAHGRYTIEAAHARVPVIVLEKPPIIWPGYAEGREADEATRKRESMESLGSVLDAVRQSGSKLLYPEVEGILASGKPIRPVGVSAIALQVLKHQPETCGEFFRVMQNVDDFGRVTVLFGDHTVAEVIGHDLSISGIRNEFSIITDFARYDLRVNANNENALFMPSCDHAGNLLFREKLPTPQGTSIPRPNQFYSHG